MMKNAMLAFAVVHVQILPEMSRRKAQAHFWEDLNIADSRSCDPVKKDGDLKPLPMDNQSGHDLLLGCGLNSRMS